MSRTARLALPLIAAGQAQKHVTHNEALAALDGIVQMRLLETERNAPPAAPAEGDAYALGASPAGVWAGRAGAVAVFSGGAWRFMTPQDGWTAWRASDARIVVRTAGVWAPLGRVLQEIGDVQALGVGTGIDPGNTLSVRARSVLFAARGGAAPGDGDLRMTINKSAVGGTASVVYQTGWSGRAEIGLAGEDAWSLKVSADGAQWRTALVADPATGAVRIDRLVSGRPVSTFAARIEAGFAPGTPALALIDGSTTGTTPAVLFQRGATPAGAISVSATGTLYGTTSDHRVKTDVAPLATPLERVARLRPCSFAFSSERDRRREGFIAHEVAEIVPEAVTGEKDAVDGEGRPVLQTLDATRLLPLLTACVQELAVKVAALERRGH